MLLSAINNERDNFVSHQDALSVPAHLNFTLLRYAVAYSIVEQGGLEPATEIALNFMVPS